MEPSLNRLLFNILLAELPNAYKEHSSFVYWAALFRHHFSIPQPYPIPNTSIRFQYSICPCCLKVWHIPNAQMVLPNGFCCQANSVGGFRGISFNGISREVEQEFQLTLKVLYEQQLLQQNFT